ncbi:MAG: hypothetical protein A2413_19865 [Treponema sp. RIFOXYC1_FULL_61_9]|nr:MAG: hypothetical protein A2413_19865 [Treponema sp. RIFOXYC1_FULL_61_9]
MKIPGDLDWIDDFWARAGGRIFARDEDGVLILPPNRVYKANPTAASLVMYLKRGGRAADLKLPSASAVTEVAAFFGDLAALYRGDEPANGTVGSVPFGFGFTSLPVLAEIALTYRCNNACRFCYAGCGDHPGSAPAGASGTPAGAPPAGGAHSSPAGGASAAVEKRPETGTRDFLRIVDIFADEARVPFFSFTGGEPLLREDLELIAKRARKRGISTNLVTNGTLADRARARSLRRAGIGSAQVSVEADEATLHDSLTGRRGAFAETLAGIAALRTAGIPVQTNTTLTRDNLAAALRMPAFLKSLGIERFAMNLFIPTIPGAVQDALFVAYDEIGPVVDAVAREAREQGLVFYWYSPTPFCSYNPIARGLGNKSCAAADGLLSVAPDGSVLPCSSWDEPIGNLLRSSFRSVWFSDAAAFYKNKLFAGEECRSCASFTACQGACPLYWRFAGETKDTRRAV